MESFAPGFGRLVLARSARQPERVERENPSLVGRGRGGGSPEMDQQPRRLG